MSNILAFIITIILMAVILGVSIVKFRPKITPRLHVAAAIVVFRASKGFFTGYLR